MLTRSDDHPWAGSFVGLPLALSSESMVQVSMKGPCAHYLAVVVVAVVVATSVVVSDAVRRHSPGRALRVRDQLE